MTYCHLYSTAGCHLCDSAWEILSEIASFTAIHVEEVDIAESDELIERYGLRIPVLIHLATQTELGWPFTREQVIAFLRASEADE